MSIPISVIAKVLADLQTNQSKQGGRDTTPPIYTPSNRRGFSPETVQAVWNKAAIIPGLSPYCFRSDCYGSTIFRSQYGNTESEYGWEVDHIVRRADGGTDYLFNLQPLQWRNNRIKG